MTLGRLFLAASILLLNGCRDTASEPVNAVVRVFGRTGCGPREFNYPRAAVIGASGLVYVVDKGGRIQALSSIGEFVLDWRMPAIDAGKPTGLGSDRDGRIYAADTHYSRVMGFARDGTPLFQFGEFGEGDGQFRMPTDVAVDSSGAIYVGEYGGHDRVSKFDADRRFLFSFGGADAGAARLARPQALCIGPDGDLWVADACNHRICRFSLEGGYLGSFGRLGDADGELRFPYGLDFMSDGTLVVCEYGNNRIQRFSSDGRPLGTWGRAGREPGRLAYPWTLVVGADDLILVVDSGNNRIQVVDGRNPGVWRSANERVK